MILKYTFLWAFIMFYVNYIKALEYNFSIVIEVVDLV